MRRLLAFLCIVLAAYKSNAQEDLFGEVKTPMRKGFIIGAAGNFDITGADMAKRYGPGYRIGPTVLYKTDKNWYWGVKFDFLLSNQIREDSFMTNISDKQGFFINTAGQRIGVGKFERGYSVGFQGGKLISLSQKNPNNGILFLTGAGFMQHKINIFVKNGDIPQLSGDYKKGYDRLTNGMYLEQFVGYAMYDKGGLINFSIGFNFLAGFTQGRRDYLFDVQRPDDKHRLDLLYGLRGSWYIPIFKKKSEEVFFE